MDKSILLQKQVRDNSEDLRAYLKELAEWEEDMKRKELNLASDNTEQQAPIVRNTAKKVKGNSSTDIEKSKSVKRINSNDYAAWDKFDVDAECEKVDQKKEEESGKSDQSDSENPSEDYKNRMRDEAVYEKERGNQFVKNKKWDEAIACYTHAIACFSKDPIFYANRALCFLKKNDLHSAEADCTSALQLDATYVKALQRRAAAREGLKQFKEAAEDLKRVLELEPHNSESKKELLKIEKKLGIHKSEGTTSKSTSDVPQLNNKDVRKEQSIKKTKEIKAEHVKKSTDVKTPATKVSIPWPERPSSSEIVIPIQKLPHQRSKKALRNIEIYETNSSDLKIDNIKQETSSNTQQRATERNEENSEVEGLSKIDYGKSNALAQILAHSTKLDVDELLKDIVKNDSNLKKTPEPSADKSESPKYGIEVTATKTSGKTEATEAKPEPMKIKMEPELAVVKTEPGDKNPECTGKILREVTVEKIDSNSVPFQFPVPKSSVQFYSNWKIMKNNAEQKFEYLKRIAPAEIPTIFRESLESDVFSDIISILNEYFLQNELNVYAYLSSLSGVKRFSALIMFMSSKDKQALKNLLHYCERKNETTKEEIDALRKKFEL